ncbi:Kazal-type serine protease inhibitor domain-containing protein [Reichenbachiella sp.]
MKTTLLAIILSISILACSEDEKECIEKLDPACGCTQEHEPVCGCNGKTYGNACMAACANITDYEEGECLN